MNEIHPESQNTLEVQNGKLNNNLLVIIPFVFVLISVILNIYLFLNNQELSKNTKELEISLMEANVDLLAPYNEDELTKINDTECSVPAESTLEYVKVCDSPWSFQAVGRFSKECLRLNASGTVFREVYENSFQISEERIELTDESNNRLSEILFDTYKTLNSDEAKAYMSQQTRIPTTGGLLYIEISSRAMGIDQGSLLSSEMKLTYYLNSFYPEENNLLGTSIKGVVKNLLEFDPEYTENRF